MFPVVIPFRRKKASLTVEAALIVPVFLFCMLTVLQYGRVMETASRISGALSDTGRQMAIAAYFRTFPQDAGVSEGTGRTGGGLAVRALTAGAAHAAVLGKAGDCSAVKNTSMVFSSFTGRKQEICLVFTYQAKPLFSIVPLPGIPFVQTAVVRAWTGREAGNADTDPASDDSGQTKVYVAENGRVYHTDPNCTHLKLSIRQADRSALKSLRNSGGGKYHACEKCHDHGEETVYVTEDGDRYHSSLECSGLKRTVYEVDREEAGHLHLCKKCAGHGS